MVIRKVPAAIAVAAGVVLSGSCEGSPQDTRPAAGEGWRLGAQLEILAGSLDSVPDHSFHRIAWALRLKGGEIVVLDGGLRSRLTVLSPTGEFLTTIGRHGEGPGEFGWVTSVQAGAQDSLFVFDAGQQRLTVFALDGATHRTATYRPVEGEMLGSVTHIGGETWLGRGLDSPRQGPMSQIVQDTVVLGLLGPDLDRLKLLASLPSLMSITTLIGARVGLGAVPFTPRALHATWGRCIFVSTADTPSIHVYSASGEYLHSFEGPGTLRPVTEKHLDAYIQNRLRMAPQDQRQIRQQALRDAPHATSLPYYYQMLTDQWGYVWLQEYSPPVGLGDRWYVLTQSGQVATELVLPASLQVYSIDEHGLLGVTVGEFDVELLVNLPIISRPLEGTGTIAECQPRGSDMRR